MHLIKRFFSFFYSKFFKLPAFSVALLLACLRPWRKVRFISISCLTIGHYSLSVEVLLCMLDRNKKRNEIILYLQKSKNEVCNIQLHKMWGRVIPIIPSVLSGLFQKVESYLEHWFGTYHNKIILGEASHDRWDVLERSKQHLYFTKNELLKGKHTLLKMGVPENAKFICLIARDNAYYLNSSTYNQMSAYRNANISSYKNAALFLAKNGFYVMRMGKAVSQSFDISHQKIIDYARSSFRSDFMDIYLSANCYFFMSTLCGLDGIAHAFRRPILATNITPHGLYDLGYPVKLFLAKKILNKKTGQLLTFKQQNEIFNMGSTHEFIHKMLEKYSLEMIDNTADEILEVTKEMVLRMQENWCETELTSELHKKFWSQIAKERYQSYGNGTIKKLQMCSYQPKYSVTDLLNNKAMLEDYGMTSLKLES